MSDWYILDEDKNVIPATVDEFMEWRKADPTAKIVKQEDVENARVSTVFLGLDHSWDGGTPIVFETMIFGGVYSDECWRYSTYDEAVAGHKEAVDRVRFSIFP